MPSLIWQALFGTTPAINNMTLEWGYNDGAQQIQPAGRIFYTRDPAAPKRLQSYVSYSDAIRAPLFVEGCYTPPAEARPLDAAGAPSAWYFTPFRSRLQAFFFFFSVTAFSANKPLPA